MELEEPADRNPRTQFLRESASSIISRNDSPDISFNASLNPYRGCEHGCPYCYARPYHEYLGFSSGLDFETRIVVKENAAEILREELSSPKWKPEVLALSAVTDCYQPVEKRLGITRQCLQVLAEFRNPVGIITKNHLVTRDADILAAMASEGTCSAHITITSLDPELSRRMEPRASLPAHRLDAIAKLVQAGLPTGVVIAPVIRDLRGGALHSSKFGERLRGTGFWADQIQTIFSRCRSRENYSAGHFEYNLDAFRHPPAPQLAFDL